MLTALKISKLKSDARDYYQAYFTTFAGDAGHHLSEYIQPRKTEWKRKFNETMDELAKLDPKCPKERL